MSVDMFEWRFREELEKLPRFEFNNQRNQAVWNSGFPAWRALFTAACLWCHSIGYKLPSYNQFFSLCKKAYTVNGPKKEEYKKFFEPPLLEGMRERIGVWYESGMSETYLYSCLVQIIEDKMKVGIVYYDARHDWKLKCDTAVIINDKIMKISAFHGSLGDRNRIEARRDEVEHVRKRNTSESSHWNNVQVKRLKELQISRDDVCFQEVNGVRLFTIDSVNELLKNIFDYAEVPVGKRLFYRDSGNMREIKV